MFSIFLVSTLYAQEEEAEEAAIELPSVKIEVIDTTQLDIPREKFRSFTSPDPTVYAPPYPKERSWYVPSTSIPEKFREKPAEAEKDTLLSLTAQFGVPQALMYQALLTKAFGNSEALLNVGRSTLESERTAELVGDSYVGLGDFTIDTFRAALTHQIENSGLEADLQYDARQLGYLDESGEEFPNDRSLVEGSAGWDQRLPGGAQSSLNFGVSSLKITDPLSSGDAGELELGGGLNFRALWPRSNPIDFGLDIRYSSSDIEMTDTSSGQEFRESILKLYLRDSHIRVWPFVLGFGLEFMLDARKGLAEDSNWGLKAYPNPYLNLTSQIGNKTTLKLGLERRVLKQDVCFLYLDKDYVRYDPGLELEKTWDFSADLQFKLAPGFTATVGGFDEEIKDLTIFEEVTHDTILSWRPDSLNSARIYGFRSGWKLLLMDGRIEQSLEYVHEEHDQEIPYKPKDSGRLTIIFFAPFRLELSLSGEFYGTRYTGTKDGDAAETLPSFFLWKPRISRAFGEHASLFLMAEFHVGEGDYQIWKGYGLPDQTVDFGLTLKF